MAVDTRNKRASCLGFCVAPRLIGPNPDGSLAIQDDRQQIAYSYSGLAAVGEGGGQPTRRRWSFVPYMGVSKRLFQPSGAEVTGG